MGTGARVAQMLWIINCLLTEFMVHFELLTKPRNCGKIDHWPTYSSGKRGEEKAIYIHRGMLSNYTNMMPFRNRKWVGMENNVKKNKADTTFISHRWKLENSILAE